MADKWQTIRVADLGRVVTGKTPPTAKPHLYGGGYPFITPTDIGNLRYCEPARQLSQEGRESQRNLLLPPQSVCVTCIASVGKICMTDRPSFTNQQINAVIVDESRHDSFFVYYLLKTQVERLRAIAGGAATPIVNKTAFSELEVSVPSLPVQRQIARILSAYDGLIENSQRRIGILETMARALFREWFVRFRFPGHENHPLVDSPLGGIPQGWEVKKLADLVSTQYGYTESANMDAVGPKYLRGMDINKTNFIDWSMVPYCSITPEDQRAYRLGRGDVVVIRMADPGKVGIVEQDVDAVFASYLIRVAPKGGRLSPYFLFYIMESAEYYAYIIGASTGTTRKSVSAGVIVDYKFVLPPQALVDQFEERACEIRSLLTALVKQAVNLRRTRELLLQRLLSSRNDGEAV